jgi:hypothetical protein
MDALTTELLARIEMLEDDVRDLQRQLDEGGVVFYADMNLVSDEQVLDLWDIEGEPEQ